VIDENGRDWEGRKVEKEGRTKRARELKLKSKSSTTN
jgi:hypothetical protein